MSTSLKLWEIGSELDVIGAMIAENDGVLTEHLEKRLDEMDSAFGEKVERIALLVREKEVMAEAAKAEVERLTRIRRVNENTAASLKDYLMRCMVAQGRKKIVEPRARVTVVQNSQPSVSCLAEDYPDEYAKLTRSLDKRKVLEAWEATSPDPEERTAPEGFVIGFGAHVRIT